MPIQYIIEPPNESDPPEAGWPLIIFLHGTTERGSNLEKLTRRGPQGLSITKDAVKSVHKFLLAISPKWRSSKLLGRWVRQGSFRYIMDSKLAK